MWKRNNQIIIESHPSKNSRIGENITKYGSLFYRVYSLEYEKSQPLILRRVNQLEQKFQIQQKPPI